MKNIYILFTLSLILVLYNCSEKKAINGLTQFENIRSITDFAPELWIRDNTFKGSFSDDYKTFYFFRKIASGVEKYIPYVSYFENGKWEDPKILAYFVENYSYTYQVKVPKTNDLYFISNIKTKADTTENPNYNFWKTELVNGEFRKPTEFGYKNLIYNYNSQPCITENGTIYFTSDLSDWSKTLSYKMELIDDNYVEPELFEPVNKWRDEENWNVFEFCLSPSEDYMIVCIQDKSDTSAFADLYISYLNDGEWTLPKKLENGINSNEAENFPVLTLDGKYLIFTKAFSEFKIVPTELFE